MKNRFLLILTVFLAHCASTAIAQIWTRIPRLCQQIAGRDEEVWCVTDDNNLWRWVWGLNDWQWVEADKLKVKNVAVGFDNSVWTINTAGEVSRFANQTWKTFPGTKLTQITALDANEALGIEENGTIWHFGNNTWEQFSGWSTWVSVGRDASLWSIDSAQPGVHKWNDTDWLSVPQADGAILKTIDVYDSGRVIATDSQWRVYMYINPGERFLGVNTPDFPPGPRWRLLEQPFPNCEQAIFTKYHMWCVSDNGFINRS